MLKHLVAAVMAVLMALFCAVRVTAAFPWAAKGSQPAQGGQVILRIPSGGPTRLDLIDIDRQLGSAFEALTLTLPPEQARGVLFLDGEQLAAGRTISRAQAARVYAFSSEETPFLTFGAVPFPGAESDKPREMRIRCINPVFPGNAIDRQNP